MKHFDFAVIGAGIEGIIVSSYLAKQGRSVCLIDSAPKIGGNLKTSALEVFRDDEKTESALHFLGTELGADFFYEKAFVEPLTFDKNTFHPFVGFGDEAPPYFNWLTAYAAAEQIFSQPSLNDLLHSLATRHPVEILTNSTVTHLTTNENEVSEILINGKTNILATHFISTVHPVRMGKWNKDLLTPKFLQKMNKSTLWTTLAVDLTHEHSKNLPGWYLLSGTKNEWFVGRFTKTGSQWLAFVSAESESDTEVTGHLFKETKKAFAKAFPDLVSKISFEKLTVLPQSHGQIQFRMNQENPFQPLKNLWICTGMASEILNPVVASVSAAQELLMDLQIHGYIENILKINDLGPTPENLPTL